MTELFHGNGIDFLALYPGQADLVFLDPPFNIGENYEHGDNLTPGEYEGFLRRLMENGYAALKPTGSMWIHLPDAHIAFAAHYCERQGWRRENWIIWHYRFGQHRFDRFINSKCHGLWISKGDPKVNRQAALVPSLRASLYGDDRSVDGERMDLDVWGFEKFWGRVQGNSAERRPLHPNQLPEVYLKRIIELTTDKGDLILDPCVGSGTTAVVANALERNCHACDLSERAVKSVQERLQIGAKRC